MKHVFTILAALFLTACNTPLSNTESAVETSLTVIDASNAGSQKIDPKQLSRLGEICGPSADKICESGLSCQFEGTQQDAGKCLPTVVNPDLECDNNQDPVCGLLGNNKNGYLNECFAQRYGAVVVNQGFCQIDKNMMGICEARAYSIGNCQQTFNGAWVNPESGQCETVTMVGCGANIPFESIKACESSCS